jgi:uncharacterized protein (UPF0332 family)
MQFGLPFVKTNLIDKKFGKLYSKLFDFRQKGDYGDLYDFDENTIKPLLGPVRSQRLAIDEEIHTQSASPARDAD